ncbi:uncharacterized protein LOC120412564 isoform X2 [Culex pipiens pallens]|uniref:uncharacterized protein LOC120412564 isoform X2 n=1 Tax=Culex pipiens pallens TaxID=42434 RepID=UPI001952B740|nr:uncharacterized protein LOC120412564 isoform X2 [Culex pipiens pallens]
MFELGNLSGEASSSLLTNSTSGIHEDHSMTGSIDGSFLETSAESGVPCKSEEEGGSQLQEELAGGSSGGGSSVSGFYTVEYPVTQVNGCRQYGPPRSWRGPSPGYGCEVYAKRIPANFTEVNLVPIFERCGRLYEIRLMMDYNNQNRRYCFVRYTNEEDARLAIELLNHHFVRGNQTIEVQKSFEKCRLFVANLPKELDRKTIEVSFRSLFPEMTRLVMHNRIADGTTNRGFAFMDFPDHGSALRAKKQTTPGCLRMWDRDIKIVWANPQRALDHSNADEVKTLFVRNVDLQVSTKELYMLFSRVVDRQDIVKISRVREFAFVEFTRRFHAAFAMHAVQGFQLNGYTLDIEWAMPPLRNSFHNMKNYDFNVLLRMKCLANDWALPILLFGRIFSMSCVQYVAVIIRDSKRQQQQGHVYLVEICTTGLSDIQSRVCEAICAFVLEIGTLPALNLVLKICQDEMKIVGSIPSIAHPVLHLARGVDRRLELFWNEIVDLCEGAHQLLKFSFDDLYAVYRRELDKGIRYCYLEDIPMEDRIIGCQDPNYRGRGPLNPDLDGREIILVLCDRQTRTNYNFSSKNNYIAEKISSLEAVGTSTLTYKVQAMLPGRFVQAGCERLPRNAAVPYGHNQYYNTRLPAGSGDSANTSGTYMLHPETGLPYQSSDSSTVANTLQNINFSMPPPPLPALIPPPQIYGPPAPMPLVPGYYSPDMNLLTQAMSQMCFDPVIGALLAQNMFL